MIAISYLRNPEKKKEPSYLQNYMQLRMSKQVQTSLNKSKVSDILGKEMAKQRIQTIRKTTRSLLEEREPSPELPTVSGAAPATAAPEQDAESEESYVENAVNQNPNSITLSVYDKKNQR